MWLSGGSVAIGIGYTWGHGTLYNSKDQKQYKFKLSGVSVADVGGAGISAEGEVYNLTNPADLSGNYSAYTAGITVGEGGSIAYLKNERGVVIALHSQTGGLRFKAANAPQGDNIPRDLTQMNSRLWWWPPKQRLAATSGSTIAPSGVPSGANTRTPFIAWFGDQPPAATTAATTTAATMVAA